MEEAKWHPKIQGVLVQGDRVIFPISWLHKQAYCEYQILLENIKGIKVWATKAMVTGTKKHDELLKEHEAKATEKGTVEEFIRRAREEKASFVVRELRVIAPNAGLHGSIDEAVIHPDSVDIIDDKPGDTAWPGNIRQIWGYCLAFRECHAPEIPIAGVMRNRDTKAVVWKETMTPENEQAMKETIARVRGIISGEREAEPTTFPKKCRVCRFHKQGKCDRSLASRQE